MLTIMFLLALLAVGVVYAVYRIYSNVVTVTISDYTLNLEVTYNGREVTLIATLLYPNNTAVPGKTIEFWNCSDSNNPSSLIHKFGQKTTNSSGIATLTIIVPRNGTYHFVARTQIP